MITSEYNIYSVFCYGFVPQVDTESHLCTLLKLHGAQKVKVLLDSEGRIRQMEI